MIKGEVVGIDIGARQIKLAIVKNGKKPRIDELTTLETPPGAVAADGTLLNMQGVAETLSKWKLGRKGKPLPVSLCLSTSNAIIREFTVPCMPDKDVLPAVEFQLAQRFPGIGHTHSLSVKVIRKDDKEIYGIVAFCPNKTLQVMTDLIAASGLNVRYIDIHPNAIAKAYSAFAEGAGTHRNAIVVDIGHFNTQVTLIREHQSILNRFVDGGGATVDRLISGNFSVDMESAEAIKLGRHPELVLDQRETESFLRLGLITVEEQLRHMFEFYSYGRYEGPISKILLAGGACQMGGITQYLSESFSILVEQARGSTGKYDVDKTFFTYMAAAGAALRED